MWPLNTFSYENDIDKNGLVKAYEENESMDIFNIYEYVTEY